MDFVLFIVEVGLQELIHCDHLDPLQQSHVLPVHFGHFLEDRIYEDRPETILEHLSGESEHEEHGQIAQKLEHLNQDEVFSVVYIHQH